MTTQTVATPTQAWRTALIGLRHSHPRVLVAEALSGIVLDNVIG